MVLQKVEVVSYNQRKIRMSWTVGLWPISTLSLLFWWCNFNFPVEHPSPSWFQWDWASPLRTQYLPSNDEQHPLSRGARVCLKFHPSSLSPQRRCSLFCLFFTNTFFEYVYKTYSIWKHLRKIKENLQVALNMWMNCFPSQLLIS